jgi:hypothetical protein
MFAITPKTLIPVLPIKNTITLPISGILNSANTPKNWCEELEAGNNDYKNIPLNFAR